MIRRNGNSDATSKARPLPDPKSKKVSCSNCSGNRLRALRSRSGQIGTYGFPRIQFALGISRSLRCVKSSRHHFGAELAVKHACARRAPKDEALPGTVAEDESAAARCGTRSPAGRVLRSTSEFAELLF